jgi:hypothetical protein
MVREELEDLVKELAAFLERPKPPAGLTIQAWISELLFIPSACLPFIKTEMRALETWPRNFPNFIKAKYITWREKNPQQNRKCPGECQKGFWEVARYLPELKEWAIFKFPCICVKDKGFYERHQLLKDRLYQREPDRYQVEPPSWSLICPDPDSLTFVRARILRHLEELRKEKGCPSEPLAESLQDFF